MYAYILVCLSKGLSVSMCLSSFMHEFSILGAYGFGGVSVFLLFFSLSEGAGDTKVCRCSDREERDREQWEEVRRSSEAATGRGQRG